MKKSLYVVALLPILTSPAALSAAIIYGDFTGDTVTYLTVTESNATDEEKFGEPAIIGDQLDFNPTNFRAQSDGAAVSEDSQLSMTIMSLNPDNPISKIRIDEGGDFTLSGLGAAQAMATVETNAQFIITHVDGSAIDPQVCSDTAQFVFTPNANGSFSLPADRGTATSWTGAIDYDVDALLATCGVNGSATKVELVLDNTLTATAADGGAAFIAKKDFRGVTTVTIPEPTSMCLTWATLAFFGAFVRRGI